MITAAAIVLGCAVLAAGYAFSVFIKSSHALQAARDERSHVINTEETRAVARRMEIESQRPDPVTAEVARIEYHSKQCALAEAALKSLTGYNAIEVPEELRDAILNGVSQQLRAVGPVGKAQFYAEDGAVRL